MTACCGYMVHSVNTTSLFHCSIVKKFGIVFAIFQNPNSIISSSLTQLIFCSFSLFHCSHPSIPCNHNAQTETKVSIHLHSISLFVLYQFGLSSTKCEFESNELCLTM